MVRRLCSQPRPGDRRDGDDTWAVRRRRCSTHRRPHLSRVARGETLVSKMGSRRSICGVLVLIFAANCSPAQTVLKVGLISGTIDVDLERYVAGVLAGESSIFRSQEALKAMAIAARTYALRERSRHSAEGFDFCDTTHCQRLDLDAVTARLRSIADQTKGELVWFEGKLAFTPYTRDCGGRTADVAEVWPGLLAPYLKSRDDPHDTVRWHWNADPSRVAESLHKSELRTPPKPERLTVAERTGSGRARTLIVSGTGESARISAGSFRFAIGRNLGWNSVASDLYEIRDGTVFVGRGSGHGVGL